MIHHMLRLTGASLQRTLNLTTICVGPSRASPTFHSFRLKEAVRQIKVAPAAAAVFVGGLRGVREMRANEMSWPKLFKFKFAELARWLIK